MKTTETMQDLNCFCNLDVSHKLLLIFIIKVVYHCTLHNKIISPAHFVVHVFWQQRPPGSATKTLKSGIFPADFLIVMVRCSVGTLSTPLGKRVRLVQRS